MNRSLSALLTNCLLFLATIATPLRANAADNPSARQPMAEGPFTGTWDSLEQYQTPEWFRDAKFGIWAHWTAQCVPEMGDWYARFMYMENQEDWKFQIANYGHMSKVGFKDIDNMWKAEKWEPARLMDLYKRAGARYFVALANHHDNFDCYDSKYQPWNSVNLGPKKDIVGIWRDEAKKAGLRFGVTVHAARAWEWFEVAQWQDHFGPNRGRQYDGNLTKADGKGTWWEGYDPQDLYAQRHYIGAPPDQEYITKFYNRTVDLINKYDPDLLYFDDYVLPFQYKNWDMKVGLDIAAHYYNNNIKRHGKLDAVLNGKILNEQQRKAMVWDIERGLASSIQPFVWQTDTCIGGWHYRKSLAEKHQYKSVPMVVHMLTDIVSKNGNLLLNVPLRGDGTIDGDEHQFLEGMASWIAVNGDAIYETRPWVVYGEGPSTETSKNPKKTDFNEGEFAYTAADVRFTTKGETLYAIALGWPTDGKLRIKSLGSGSKLFTKKIDKVELLGSKEPLKWSQVDGELVVNLPQTKPCEYAFSLKVATSAVATN